MKEKSAVEQTNNGDNEHQATRNGISEWLRSIQQNTRTFNNSSLSATVRTNQYL